MTMTQEQFETLVARLEQQAAHHPAAYKFKLGAFATLGYAYVFGMLFVLLGVTAGLVYAIATGKATILAKLVILIGILVAVVLKSLWVKLEAPCGLQLTAHAFPRLFEVIDEIRQATGAPRAHKVLMTDELNASIVQVPRLGMFGWQENYLILGLPLMQLLSVSEFKAVLAHEFGHLSGAHGRFGAWIYRIRAGWARLARTLEANRQWGRFLFVPFFNWYAPKFSAYSFVQARAHEYAADQVAATAFGAAPLADALVRLDLKSEELSRHYWPEIFAAADDEPLPRTLPFQELLVAERRGFLPQASEHLREALARSTDTTDTHPSLRDRLAALARPASVPDDFELSAAECLLDGELRALVAHFDQTWQIGVDNWWRNRHEHVSSGRAKLAELSTVPTEKMDDATLWEYAIAVEEFTGMAPAFELYRELVEVRGATGAAKFAYARLMLEQNDESGIRLIDEVMAESPEAILSGCELIVGYLRDLDRADEAEPYIERYHARQGEEDERRAARQSIGLFDEYLSPTLSAATRAAIIDLLGANKARVKQAYVVRKAMPAGEEPVHVLGLVRRTKWIELESVAANLRLIEDFANALTTEEEVILVTLNDGPRTYLRRFRRVPDSRLAF